MSKNIQKKIIKAWKQFADKHDKQPTKLLLTTNDEWEVYGVLPEISESLAQQAFVEGIRVAVPKIYGFKVVYGAKKFGFE